MDKPFVYLAGGIRGLTFEEAVAWRTYVADRLSPEIVCLSPMRGKEFLDGQVKTFQGALEGHPLLSVKGVMTRDLNDVRRSSLVFAKLDEAKAVSIGTVWELATAHELRIPILIVIEPKEKRSGTPHDHSWIDAGANFVIHNLDHGIAMTRAILLPNPGTTPLNFVVN